MYASIRNTVRIFDLEFLFSNCSRKDNHKTHIIIHILIGMFNCNPMIPQYLKLVEYSQIYSHLCWPPLNFFTGQLRRHPSCTMACRILVIPQFETTQYLTVFQRVHSTTVTGQTFSVRYVERFHFLNLLLLDCKTGNEMTGQY